MEAIAKFDFTATAESELSFKKGSVLKIIDMEADKNWYKAEQHGKEGMVPINYINCKPHEWFVGTVGKQTAENLLLKRGQDGAFVQHEGAFVVRYSEETAGDFTLAVKSGDKVQHFKVLRDGVGKYFLWVVKFNSLNQMVEYHRAASVTRKETLYLKDRVDTGKMAYAQYDFTARESDELSCQKFDVLEVLKEFEGFEWWLCSLDGRQGKVPSNYLKKF